MVSYSDLTDRAAVRWAVSEFDRLGRDAFLERFGFGVAREYFLVVNGSLYDSKAIFAAAYERQHGVPVSSKEISGGKGGAAGRLVQLGFEVQGNPVQQTRPASRPPTTCSEHFVEIPAAGSCPYC